MEAEKIGRLLNHVDSWTKNAAKPWQHANKFGEFEKSIKILRRYLKLFANRSGLLPV